MGDALDSDADSDDLEGLQPPNKRFKADLGQSMQSPKVFLCNFGSCTKEFPTK